MTSILTFSQPARRVYTFAMLFELIIETHSLGVPMPLSRQKTKYYIMEQGYPIAITSPLQKTDVLQKGDYIYEIRNDSELPFEKVLFVTSMENSIISTLDICSNEQMDINLTNDNLANYQKLQLPTNVRKSLGLE